VADFGYLGRKILPSVGRLENEVDISFNWRDPTINNAQSAIGSPGIGSGMDLGHRTNLDFDFLAQKYLKLLRRTDF